MRILFDHQIFMLQKYGGISRYFANLNASLNNTSGVSSELALLYTHNYFVKERAYLSQTAGGFLLKKERKLNKWNKRYSELKISKNEFDVFHPTYYDPYFLDKIKKPFVVTVHDMIHEMYPEYFPFDEHTAHFKRRLFEKADHLIAISESTKKDLQLIYNIKGDKISVIHHGYQISNDEENAFEPPLSDYILFVGDRTKYKNFNKFIDAIVPLMNRNPDIGLICAGGGVFQIVEQELLLRKKISNVMQISANDEELKILYRKALVFVYPSLAEGFGLPILEAFANACPTIVSDISPFREIAGLACAYFNPNDVEDMSNQIEKVIYSSEAGHQLRNAGGIQLKQFSLGECVEKTIKVYQSLS